MPAPELLASPATGKAVADVVKTSDEAAWNAGPRTLNESATGKAVADVVKTSDEAALATPRTLGESGYGESRRRSSLVVKPRRRLAGLLRLIVF